MIWVTTKDTRLLNTDAVKTHEATWAIAVLLAASATYTTVFTNTATAATTTVRVADTLKGSINFYFDTVESIVTVRAVWITLAVTESTKANFIIFTTFTTRLLNTQPSNTSETVGAIIWERTFNWVNGATATATAAFREADSNTVMNSDTLESGWAGFWCCDITSFVAETTEANLCVRTPIFVITRFLNADTSYTIVTWGAIIIVSTTTATWALRIDATRPTNMLTIR